MNKDDNKDINEEMKLTAQNSSQTNGGDTVTISKKKLAAIIIIILLLLIGGVFALVHFLGGNDSGTASVNPDIDPGAQDYVAQSAEAEDSAGGIQIPGYASISLPANETNVQVALLNPEGNPCYFTFEIVLDDTGESIYKSKMVPPGKALTNITLTKALDEGTYDATIKITTNSTEDLSAMNGADVKTQLIVK